MKLAGWGNRAELLGTLKALEDIQGNRDGLWSNEQSPAGTTGALFDRNPLLLKAKAFLAAGASSRDEIGRLAAFTATQEARFGQPIVATQIKAQLRNPELFAAQKAIELVRLDRTPDQVRDGFVAASGTVNGQAIADRQLFYQHFAPLGEPTGKVIVVSPGFQETGRNFYDQVDQLSRQGHDVLVMDHQWAGQSEGRAGAIDRGFGVSRDVAAMAAYAGELAQERYGKRGEVVLLGNSMGAGPGVLGALTLNDAGLIQLNGPQMPKGLSAVLQSPYLGATENVTNFLLQAASKMPVLNRFQAPSAGLPVLTTDPVAGQRGAQGAVLEDVRAELRSMGSAQADLDFVLGLIGRGEGPRGRLMVVHGDGDPLADPGKSRWLGEQLGDRAQVQIVASNNHVFQQSPAEQGFALKALAQLVARDA